MVYGGGRPNISGIEVEPADINIMMLSALEIETGYEVLSQPVSMHILIGIPHPNQFV